MSTTAEHDPIDLRKILAEIENLRADTLRMQAETQRIAEERERLRAEAAKLNSETKFHPVRFVASVAIGTTLFIAALVGLVIAAVKALL